MRAPPAFDDYYAEFGRRVRAARQRCGMKQAQLGRLVGLGGSSISNIEAGRQHPYLDTCVAIAQSLDVDFMTLVPPTQDRA